MAIGFAVDYSAHVAHAYVTSDKATANERVIEALSTLGASVLMGGEWYTVDDTAVKRKASAGVAQKLREEIGRLVENCKRKQKQGKKTWDLANKKKYSSTSIEYRSIDPENMSKKI